MKFSYSTQQDISDYTFPVNKIHFSVVDSPGVEGIITYGSVVPLSKSIKDVEHFLSTPMDSNYFDNIVGFLEDKDITNYNIYADAITKKTFLGVEKIDTYQYRIITSYAESE